MQVKELFLFIYEVIFFLCSTLNIVILTCKDCIQVSDSNHYIWIIGLFYASFYCFINELKEIRSFGFRRYILSLKNIFDLLYASILLFYTILCTIEVKYKYTEVDSTNFSNLLQVTRSICALILCLKGVNLLQLIEFIGTMIRIIIHVIIHAYKLFFILVVVFAVMDITIVSLESITVQYQLEKNYVYYYMIFSLYTLLLGDSSRYFGIVDYNNANNWLMYAYYFAASAIFAIMFNLLITVLGEGYEIEKELQKNYENQSYLDLVMQIDNSHKMEYRKPREKNSWIYFIYDFLVFLFNSIFFKKIITDKKYEGSVFTIATLMENDEEIFEIQKKNIIKNGEHVKEI